MAYHNISYGSAIRVLVGKEDRPVNQYDRYEEPERWHKLPPIRSRNLYNKSSQTQGMDKITPQDNRNMIGRGAYRKRYNEEKTIKLDNKEYKEKKYERRNQQPKKDTNSNLHNYWKQFNSRKSDIPKEKHGIGLCTPELTPQNAETNLRIHEEETEEEEVEIKLDQGPKIPDLQYSKEIMKKIMNKLLTYLEEDYELRGILYTMLEGPRREIQEEEQGKRQRLIVQESKRKFWQDRKERNVLTFIR